MTRDIPVTNTLQAMEYDRENWINEAHRHCRIGKVTPKAVQFVPNVSPILQRLPPWSQPGTGYVNPFMIWTC